MRATRAYLVGLGTSGVLLAGVVTLLLVASAVVAFRGAMPAAIAAGIRDLVLEDPAPGLRVKGPSRIAAQAAPAAAGVGAARAPVPAGTSGGGAPGRSAAAPAGPGPKNGRGGRDTAPSGLSGSASQSGSSSSAPAPSAEAPAPGPAADLNQGADTAEGVTGGAGETAAQVSPELGRTVGETGEGVGDVARGLDAPR
ncbi:MAG: hypothetical protein WKF29_00515 [Thermoleophilaceae bacterium]